MNVVNFAEGILGVDQTAAPLVAKCLKRESEVIHDPSISKRMNIVANCLELGMQVRMEVIREIGEKPLADTQRLFLSL